LPAAKNALPPSCQELELSGVSVRPGGRPGVNEAPPLLLQEAEAVIEGPSGSVAEIVTGSIGSLYWVLPEPPADMPSVGRSLTGLIVIFTVATVESTEPSLAL